MVDTPAASPTEPGHWQTFGPLAPYLLRPGVTDVFVTGTGELWTDDTRDGLRLETSWRADRRTARELAVRLIAAGGRHIDEAAPFVDVRLRGGVRVHAVLPPVSTGGALLSIRVPSATQPGLDELVASGAMEAEERRLLLEAVRARTNLLITGAGGAGKTTLLAALLGHAPPGERIVVIEDVAELDLSMRVNHNPLTYESKRDHVGLRHESHIALMACRYPSPHRLSLANCPTRCSTLRVWNGHCENERREGAVEAQVAVADPA